MKNKLGRQTAAVGMGAGCRRGQIRHEGRARRVRAAVALLVAFLALGRLGGGLAQAGVAGSSAAHPGAPASLAAANTPTRLPIERNSRSSQRASAQLVVAIQPGQRSGGEVGTRLGLGRRWVPSAGVDGSLARLTRIPSGWTASIHTLRADGLKRSYLMIRPPPSQAAPLPVVVVLSGRTADPVLTERISRLIPIVGNAIIVYPAGYADSWNAGGCCGLAHASGINDVAFVNAVIQQVANQPNASRQRVYVLGFSNGGRMAYRLACADPGALAGVAVVEAVPVFDCHRLHPTPIVIVAQSADPLLTIPANGTPRRVEGYTEPTVQATVETWRRLDGCAPKATLSTLGNVQVATYAHCSGNGRLEYDLYAGGGHVWPKGNRTTPSAGQLIWPFLQTGTLPTISTIAMAR